MTAGYEMVRSSFESRRIGLSRAQWGTWEPMVGMSNEEAAVHDLESVPAGVHRLGSGEQESLPPGGVAVLVLDPVDRGRVGGPPRIWNSLADNVRVLWLSLPGVEDPLVHARALLERQVDQGVRVYVVTSRHAERTALLLAAHRVDVVSGVFVGTDGAGISEDVTLRHVLDEHDVPVWTVESNEYGTNGAPAEKEPLDRAEVLEALVRELLDHDVRTTPATGETESATVHQPSLTAEAVTVFTAGLTALLHRVRGAATGQHGHR